MGLCKSKRFVSTWCSLIIYFIGMQKKKHVVHRLYTVFPIAEEEGISFTRLCSWSDPTGADSSSEEFAASLVCLGEALGPELVVLQHSLQPVFVLPGAHLPPLLSLPPCQASGITAIGTDTLPMATSNLFKALEAECWPRGLPWLTAFAPFFHLTKSFSKTKLFKGVQHSFFFLRRHFGRQLSGGGDLIIQM